MAFAFRLSLEAIAEQQKLNPIFSGEKEAQLRTLAHQIDLTKNFYWDLIKTPSADKCMIVSGFGKPGTIKSSAVMWIAYFWSVIHKVKFTDQNIQFNLTKWQDLIENSLKKGEIEMLIALLDEQISSFGCLSYDTNILTQLGVFSLKELFNKINLRLPMFSYNFRNNKIENDLGLIINSGKREIYEIEFESRNIIRSTKKHNFFVKRDNKIIQMKIEDLKKGDKIISFDKIMQTEIIKSIKYIGKENTYDVNMLKNHNFLLANGILTHNSGSKRELAQVGNTEDTIRKFHPLLGFISPDPLPHPHLYAIETIGMIDEERKLGKCILHNVLRTSSDGQVILRPMGFIVTGMPPDHIWNPYMERKIANMGQIIERRTDIDRYQKIDEYAKLIIQHPHWSEAKNKYLKLKIIKMSKSIPDLTKKEYDELMAYANDYYRKQQEENSLKIKENQIVRPSGKPPVGKDELYEKVLKVLEEHPDWGARNISREVKSTEGKCKVRLAMINKEKITTKEEKKDLKA